MKTVNRVGSIFLRSILRRMKELGVTQTELAKRMNASRPYVVKVLHGDVNITLGSAARFAKALQLDFFPEFRDEKGRRYEAQEEPALACSCYPTTSTPPSGADLWKRLRGD